MNEEKITKAITIAYFLLVITLSFFPSIEPFYTITNDDQYVHEVNMSITSHNGEYAFQRHYEIGPGETIEVKKPVSLMFKWLNPLRKADIFYSASEYSYIVTLDEYEYSTDFEPGISTGISLELHNETKQFPIEIIKIRN